MAVAQGQRDPTLTALLLSVTSLVNSTPTIGFFFNKAQKIDDDQDVILAAAVALSQLPCTRSFATEVVPSFSDSTFKRHFRMSRSTVEYVLRMLPWDQPSTIQTETTVPRETKVLLSLWTLGHSESFASAAVRFGLASRSQAHNIFLKFCSAVADCASDLIQWPKGLHALRTRHEFGQLKLVPSITRAGCSLHFPDTIGCIDAVYLEVVVGRSTRSSFVNSSRSRYVRVSCTKLNQKVVKSTVALQAVCDAKLLFTNVFIRWPPKRSIGRGYRWGTVELFKRSPLHRALRVSSNMIPPNCHLLGGIEYPLSEFLLTPYASTQLLQEQQQLFNETLLATRDATIGRAFSQLLGRFSGRLEGGGLSAVSQENVSKVVLACCVLHNLCTTLDDRPPGVDNVSPVRCTAAVPEMPGNDGVRKRDKMAERLMQPDALN